jgi:hypothetical protein
MIRSAQLFLMAIVFFVPCAGTIRAQHEAIRNPPAELSAPGNQVQLRSEARPFLQPSQLQAFQYPAGVAIAGSHEQPERLPQPPADSGFIDANGTQPNVVPYDPLDMPPDAVAAAQEFNSDGTPKLRPFKQGFFQKLSLSAAWLGDGNDPADLGITEIETSLTVALPAPIRDWPLFITPGYNLYLLSDPGGLRDLPPQLHTVYLDFTWAPQFFQHHRLLLTVAPSIYSDFENDLSSGFRVTGKALWVWDANPDKLQFVAGILYLNRDNIRLLPAGGAIWKPTPDFNFELIFPKPKLAMRVNVGAGYEDWIFVTAEFGGNTWAIQRDSGLNDTVTWIDYRLMAGYERRLDGGAGYRLEAGYVFGRNVEYGSGLGDYSPQNTFLIRGGITF